MSSRRAWIWALVVIAVSIAVYWPAVHVRYFADDYLQIAKIEGHFGPHNPAALYSFFPDDPAATAMHIKRGSLPWWTVEHFKFVHVRPLASLLIELDHAIAPRGAFVHHLHSLAWLAAMLAAAHVLLRRTLTPVIAGLALLMMAVDETLAWNVAWVANRCALISATFVFVALAVHVRRTDNPTRASWGVELALWIGAVSGGEYAVCGMAYLAAYTLIGRTDGWRTRARALVPAVIALGTFAILYRAMGAGVAGGTSYIDPFAQTDRFLNEFMERASRTAGETWLSVPGETERLWNRYYDTPLPKAFVIWNQYRSTVSLEQAHGRFAFGAVALIVVPIWLLARRFLEPDERRTVGWTAVGSLLSLVPLAATPPVTRTLALGGLGPAVFVAAVAVAAVRAWRVEKATILARVHAVALSLVALAALIQHGWLDVVWSRKHIDRIGKLGEAYEDYILDDATRDLDLKGKHVIVLAAPELVSAVYGQWIMSAIGGPVPKTWHTLAMGKRRYIVRRYGKRSLELSAIDDTMHLSLQETLFRSPAERLVKGDEVDAGVFSAKVVQELPWRGPSALLFRFRRELEDPSLVFLVSGEHGLQPFQLPEPGKSVALPIPDVPHENIDIGAPK